MTVSGMLGNVYECNVACQPLRPYVRAAASASDAACGSARVCCLQSFGQGPSEEHDAPLSEDASKKRERKKGSYRGPSPVEEGSRKSTFTNHFQEENSTARVDGKSRKKRRVWNGFFHRRHALSYASAL